MKNKYALYPFVMGILAFLCFLAVVFFIATAVQPLWGLTMILLLPAVILWTVGFFAVTGKLNKNKTTVLTTILTALLLLASVFYTFLLSILTATTETTDIRFYPRAYEVIEDEDGVEDVFPRKLPTDAENIEFYYRPQFLQGGEVFELSYTTTDEKLAEWAVRLTEEAEWIGSNKEWHKTTYWGFHNADSTRYHLYWDGGYNHGEMSYVLIDEDTNRITFYYSKW